VIDDDLRALGIRPGDLVMPHVSMRRVGPVVGGALGLVEAIDRAVGPEGTVLVNVGIDNGFAAVHERPVAEQAQALAGLAPVDPATAPADPDNGVFAEVFRAAAGTLVTGHPEGRLAARGARAAEVLGTQPWDDYYGPRSPLGRFVAMGGRVLRLGADRDTVTLLHLAEALAEVPDKRRVVRMVKVEGPDGPVVRAVSTWDDSSGIGPPAPDGVDDAVTILDAFMEQQIGTEAVSVGRVGGADAELLDGSALVRFATAWFETVLPGRR
jgi:aminoglycoside N3'-acetyltransferase